MDVEEVLDKYTYLEEYLRDYIEMLAENARRKVIIGHYFRWHTIILPSDYVYHGFPSFSHWKFNKKYNANRPVSQPFLFLAD
jgi:hypothetical protein